MTISTTNDVSDPIDQARVTADLSARFVFTTAVDIPAVDGDEHWHQFDAEFVVTAGLLRLRDVAANTVHECGPGTRVQVPAKTVHAEQSPQGYTIILGTSVTPEHFGDPVDRPVEELAN